MRILVLTLSSILLCSLVISYYYACIVKQQLNALVYLINYDMTLGMYLQLFFIVWFVGKFLKTIFFGTYHEIEHLIDSSWYIFASSAAFHQDLKVVVVTMVVFSFVMINFDWLVHGRVDFMASITWVFHIKTVLLFTLLFVPLQFRGFCLDIVFTLEYAILLLNALFSALYNIKHTQSEVWEDKPIQERINIISSVVLYIVCMAFMLLVLFVPLYIAKRMSITAKKFGSISASRSVKQQLTTFNNTQQVSSKIT